MTRVAAILPGYATVKRAAEVLHLAPRSVRDLIYGGRLPSVRVGRQHFVHGIDLDVERRRRLGPRLPARAARSHPARVGTHSKRGKSAIQADAVQTASGALADGAQDGALLTALEAGLGAVGVSDVPAAARRAGRGVLSSAVRRQRAAEREGLVAQWAERHRAAAPTVPFAVNVASASGRCTICNRGIRAGRLVAALPDNASLPNGASLCLPCGRRALLDWADRRRLEAVAARRMAQDLSLTVLPDETPSRRAAA